MIGALNKGWELVYKDDVEHLTKTFEFSDFKASMSFVNQIAEIAEKNNHHPNIAINFNKVEITTTTHSEGNRVTDKDEKLALEIEAL